MKTSLGHVSKRILRIAYSFHGHHRQIIPSEKNTVGDPYDPACIISIVFFPDVQPLKSYSTWCWHPRPILPPTYQRHRTTIWDIAIPFLTLDS